VTQFLLVVAAALTVGAIVFGITVLVTGEEEGLRPVEPDGRAMPLAGDRPLVETDLTEVRFDTVLRGYRMAQVDAALKRAAYDIGYKDELIKVLQAEVDALRDGRRLDAEVLRRAREAALEPVREARPAQSVSLAAEPVTAPREPVTAPPEPVTAPREPVAPPPEPDLRVEPEPAAEPEREPEPEPEPALTAEPEPEPELAEDAETEPQEATEPGDEPATATRSR
jgi:DivIVA domain-containing protein